MARFSEAIDNLIREEVGDDPEGGYTNDPDDPGGETKWGISKAAYPELDIKTLTREQAEAIYRSDYWDLNRISAIRDQLIAERYFSFVVNMGRRSAGRIVQRALRAVGVRVEIDGWVGTKTRAAINKVTSDGPPGFESSDEIWRSWYALLAAIRSEAAGHYRLLIEQNPRLERFRNGWMNRAYR